MTLKGLICTPHTDISPNLSATHGHGHKKASAPREHKSGEMCSWHGHENVRKNDNF